MSGHEPSHRVLQTLYERYSDDIFRYALYTLKSEADALDTVQETFLRAWRAWDQFRGEAAAKTWLFRIAHNYMVDTMRKQQTAEHYWSRQFTQQPRSEQLATDIEVQEILDRLPDTYREVVLLRAIEGHSVTETGRILDLSDTNVRVTYHRAKKLLDRLLRAAEDDSSTQRRRAR